MVLPRSLCHAAFSLAQVRSVMVLVYWLIVMVVLKNICSDDQKGIYWSTNLLQAVDARSQ